MMVVATMVRLVTVTTSKNTYGRPFKTYLTAYGDLGYFSLAPIDKLRLFAIEQLQFRVVLATVNGTGG